MPSTVPAFSKAVATVQSQQFQSRVQLTATVAGIFRWRAPQNCVILGTGVYMRAKGGTHATSTLAVKNGAATVSTFDLAALAQATRGDGALANVSVAKDAEVTCDLTISGGTSPTIDDLSVQIDYAVVE